MNGHQETSNVKCIRQSSSSGNFRKTLSQKKKKRKEKKQVKKKYTVETLSQPVHAHTNIFNPISLKIPENC